MCSIFHCHLSLPANLDQVSVQDFCHLKVNRPTVLYWPHSLRGKYHALIMSGAPFKTCSSTRQNLSHVEVLEVKCQELDQSQSTTLLHIQMHLISAEKSGFAL